MGIILEVALGVVLGLFVWRYREFFVGSLLLLGLLAGAIYVISKLMNNPDIFLILGLILVMYIVGNLADGTWATPWAKKPKG
jgi:hypothetical protein